jgi:hypothetical protein
MATRIIFRTIITNSQKYLSRVIEFTKYGATIAFYRTSGEEGERREEGRRKGEGKEKERRRKQRKGRQGTKSRVRSGEWERLIRMLGISFVQKAEALFDRGVTEVVAVLEYKCETTGRYTFIK